MTKREIASLSIKLIGVYFLAKSIDLFYLFFISSMNIRTYDLTTLIAPLCQLIPIITYLVILFLLIVKSNTLATKLIKNDSNFNLSLSVNKDEIMMIAFCCIGLSLLIHVIPNVISTFIQSLSYVRYSNMYPNNPQDSYWSTIGIPRIISLIFKTVVGVYLFLYPKRVINLWKNYRRDGIDYQFGEVKIIDDLSLGDIQKYPIWALVVDKNGKGGTFVKPVINSENVTADLIEPIISFRIEDSEFYGSCNYDAKTQKLENLTLWIDEKWVLIQDTTNLVPPLTLVAIPQINGRLGVKFRYESFDKSGAHLIR